MPAFNALTNKGYADTPGILEKFCNLRIEIHQLAI